MVSWKDVKETLKVLRPQELLKDMKLRNPEISVMISETLSLTDETFHDDYFEGRYGRKEYHLIELGKIRRCLLQVPIAISSLQYDDPNEVWDAIDFLGSSLDKKYNKYDLGIFIIYEGKLARSFKPYLLDKKTYSKINIKCIDLGDLLHLKNEPEESRQICIRDYFELKMPTAETAALQSELKHLEEILKVHNSNLSQAELEEAKYGGRGVPPELSNRLRTLKEKIKEVEAKIGEINRKMGN